MFHSLSSWAGLLAYSAIVTAIAIPQDVTTTNDTASISSSEISAQQYDYIIVGGGLTGLVAANRLSENGRSSVLVLEFGPFDRSNTTLWPFYATSLNLKDMFNITTAPEPFLGGGRYAVRAGSVPGGGSTVNGMQLDRASAGDYDSFEMLDNPGWGWKTLLKYFKKSTHFNAPEPEIVEKYNYTWDSSAYGNGPLQAAYPEFQYPDNYPFFDGFKELDIPFVKEHAAGNAVGVYWTPASLDQKTMTRSSSLNAYYDPVSKRSNLKMLVEHQVFEITFEPNSLVASGVKAIDRKTNREVSFKAKKEVILAAGAVHTPQILQLSGIGPKSVLDAAGVETKLDFPAIGSNYQDHPTAYLNWNVTNSFPYPGILQANATYNAEALALYLNQQTGPYTKAQANSVGFLSMKMLGENAAKTALAALEKQDAAAFLPPIYANKHLLAGFVAQRKILVEQYRKGSVAAVEIPFAGTGGVPNALQKPLSRGTVHLNATNPRGEPVVTNYAFQNPFDKDQLFAALQWTRKLMSSDALARLNPVETMPGSQYQTRDTAFEALRVGRTSFGSAALTTSFAHPSCSCPMMPKNKGGCVGADLLVYGTKKLSIIDASIMPIIPAAHLQASLYATAEKAADVIKSRK